MITMEHLNLLAIKYFIKVAERGNITQAANELFITQPVLSRQIKALERDTGLQLFVRLKYGVTLTEKGKRFYAYCKDLEAHADAFCNQLAALNGSNFYNLKIGYQQTSEQLMFAANSLYVHDFPDSTISVIRQEGLNLKKMLREHQVGIAYNSESEYTHLDQDISYVHLMFVPQMLVVSNTNPLSRLERIHFSQLRKEKWIFPTKTSMPQKWDMLFQNCRLFNFEPNIISYEMRYSDFLANVIMYNAVAILPFIREVALTNSQVTFIPLDGFPFNQNVGLMWLTKDTGPAIERYVACAKKAAAAQGLDRIQAVTKAQANDKTKIPTL